MYDFECVYPLTHKCGESRGRHVDDCRRVSDSRHVPRLSRMDFICTGNTGITAVSYIKRAGRMQPHLSSLLTKSLKTRGTDNGEAEPHTFLFDIF